MRHSTTIVTLAALGLLAREAGAQAAGREPHTYMKKVGFADAEIAGLDAGKVVARVVPEKDDNEADVLGVVHIAASPETLIDALRHIETWRTGDPVIQIGRFASPPKVDDLRALTFEAEDLDNLSKCRIGDCDVKVGTRALEFVKKIDWKAPDAKAKASQAIKETMVKLVDAYLEQGSAAMSVYNDNDQPLSVAAEVAKILDNSPNLVQYNPEFVRYLLDFPKATLPDVENLFYWSKEKIRKPVVSVAHVCIQKLTRGADTAYFVAVKHLYDSHYFLANLEFFTLVPAEGGKGFYLVHDIRARIDPPSKFRGLLLGKIKGAMKDAVAADLAQTKRRLESTKPSS